MKTVKFKSSVSDDKMLSAICEDLRNGVNKKEIANKYGIDVSAVICTANRYRDELKTSELPDITNNSSQDNNNKNNETEDDNMFTIFGRTVKDSSDRQILALSCCFNGDSRKSISRRYKMNARTVNQLFQARQLIKAAENEAMLSGYSRFKNNSLICKLVKIVYPEIMLSDSSEYVYITYNNDTKEFIVSDQPWANNKMITDKPEEEEVVSNNNESNVSENNKQRKKPITITEDIVSSVLLDRISNNKSYDYIVDKYNISKSTVYNIINGHFKAKYPKAYETYDATDSTSKENTTSNQPTETDNTTPNDNILKSGLIHPVNISTSFRCGLVVDRHQMPTKFFVFNNIIDEKLMFDYDSIDDVCRKFINTNIKFENGVANKDIILYVTGLQCALASFIKVCYEMHVNLSLMHYNSRNKTYRRQVIWDIFDKPAKCSGIPVIKDIVGEYNNVFTYKNLLHEIVNNQNIYTMRINDHSNSKNNCITFCKDLNDAFELYNNLVKTISIEKKTTIVIDKYEKSCPTVAVRILKTQNF